MRRILDWDTAFFGCRIARLDPEDLAAAESASTEAWLREQRVACAYLLVALDDQAGLDRARGHGFRLIDARVTLEATGAPPAEAVSTAGIRPAAAGDTDTLKAIARHGHRDGRFHVDGNFGADRCDEFYATWIANSCAGWADRVFVADDSDGPKGYVTVHRRADKGEIGLVGVSADARGRGVASRLLGTARQWCAEQGLARVSVVTQGRNRAAMRLYQSAGFEVTDIQLWHHRWLTAA